MKSNNSLIIVFSFVFILFGTRSIAQDNQSVRNDIYASFFDENPTSILIMPPINNTTNVSAKEYFYTSIYQFLLERGYYVFSPELSLSLLQEESANDAELFIDGNLEKFREIFGADALLFTTINEWNKWGSGIKVKIKYELRSARTSDILYKSSVKYVLDTKVMNYGEIDEESDIMVESLLTLTALFANSVSKLATPTLNAALKANRLAFRELPRGKYYVE